MITFTPEELKLIGRLIEGSFYMYDNEMIIYSSHTFPAHRITVNKAKAKEYLEEYYKSYQSTGE
jgi:hypothetical protein